MNSFTLQHFQIGLISWEPIFELISTCCLTIHFPLINFRRKYHFNLINASINLFIWIFFWSFQSTIMPIKLQFSTFSCVLKVKLIWLIIHVSITPYLTLFSHLYLPNHKLNNLSFIKLFFSRYQKQMTWLFSQI